MWLFLFGFFFVCALGFQDRLDHRHEGARLVPVEPRGLLRPRRPVEAGVGKRRPGPRQPPVHPTARRQVTQQEGHRFNPAFSLGGKYKIRLCKTRAGIN